jgi:hypothetical protein
VPTTNIISNIDQLTLPIYQVLQEGRFNPYYKDTVACGFGSNMFSSFLEMWADEEYICMPNWKRVEEQNDCKLVTVNAATITATGATVTITDPYKISGTYTNIQPGFLVGIPPIGKTAYVVSINKDTPSGFTMVLKPYDSGFTSHIATGSKLWVIPVNARNEGACDIGNSSSSVPGIERNYDMAILSRRYSVTRTAAQSFCKKLEIYKQIVNYDGVCKEVDTLWSNDLENTYQEFYYGREVLRLFGDSITNTSNVSITRSMQGVIPQLRAKARNLDFSASEGYTVDDVDDFTLEIKSVRGYCNEYFLYAGKNVRASLDTALALDFPNGAISYGAFDGLFDYNSAPGSLEAGNGKQRAIAYGFTSVQKNGVTLHLHDVDAFNDECLGGAAGFNYPNTFFGMPACPMACGGQGTRKAIELTFLGDNGTGTTSNSIVRDFGILRADTYKGCDDHNFDIISEEGIEVVCADRWIFGEAV